MIDGYFFKNETSLQLIAQKSAELTQKSFLSEINFKIADMVKLMIAELLFEIVDEIWKSWKRKFCGLFVFNCFLLMNDGMQLLT